MAKTAVKLQAILLLRVSDMLDEDLGGGKENK